MKEGEEQGIGGQEDIGGDAHAQEQPSAEAGGQETAQTAQSSELPDDVEALKQEVIALRKFQGDADRWKQIAPQVKELQKHGSLELVEQFVREMLPVVQRDDWKDYVQGRLGSKRDERQSSQNDDDLLTEEERWTRDRIQKTDQQLQEQNVGLVTTKAELAEAKLINRYGEDLWKDRREAVYERVQQMAQNGQLNHRYVNEKLIDGILWSVMEPEERAAFAERLTDRRRQQSNGRQTAQATTPPNSERPGAQARQKPRSLREAIQRGVEDHQRQGASA